MSIPAPPVIQLGASIAVATTTELGTLDVSHLNPGTQVFVSADNSLWTLEISTATVGAGVVAVAGITGWRWIEQGGTSGFVTLAQLADVSATSGATLVGVNANGGMFSEPDLQHVLQEDVVLKVPLAATDGTGGASLVGIQDTGGYFTGTVVETALQELGAGSAGKQTVANPTEFTESTGNVFGVNLSDAGTNSTSILANYKHQTSGAAAAGFGSIIKTQLENAAGALIDAVSFLHRWVTATGGAEDSALDIQAARAGTQTTLATFSGKNASGNYPVSYPARNADTISIAYTAAGDQEIHKLGASGNLYHRIADRAGATMGVAMTQLYSSLLMVQNTVGDVPDTILGPNSGLAANAVNGYVWIPTVTGTGAQTGTPTLTTGNFANHVPLVFNTTDSKLWIRTAAGTWKSVLFV